MGAPSLFLVQICCITFKTIHNYNIDINKNIIQVIEEGTTDSLSLRKMENTPYIEIHKVHMSAIDGQLYFYYHGKPIFDAYQSRGNLNISNIRSFPKKHQLLYDIAFPKGEPLYTYVYDISNPEIMKFVKKIKIKK